MTTLTKNTAVLLIIVLVSRLKVYFLRICASWEVRKNRQLFSLIYAGGPSRCLNTYGHKKHTDATRRRPRKPARFGVKFDKHKEEELIEGPENHHGTGIEILPHEMFCDNLGRHHHPDFCDKFLVCTVSDVNVLDCPEGLAYNRKLHVCMRDWSSCPLIGPCTYVGQKLTVPHDQYAYLLCVERNGLLTEGEKGRGFKPAFRLKSNYRVIKEYCPDGEVFKLDKQDCEQEQSCESSGEDGDCESDCDYR